MAYPTVNAPYGLKPVSSVDGKPYAGATRQLGISLVDNYSNPAGPIYCGDVVYLGAADLPSGYRVKRWEEGVSYAPLGVFMGCTYINPVTKQPTWSQYWPGPTAAPDAMAYIVDDPMALFKVVVTELPEVEGDDFVSAAQYWAIGMNLTILPDFNGTDGNNNTGDSAMSARLPAYSNTAYGGQLRVIDVVPETKTSSGYPEVLVKFNPQAYNVTTGPDAPLVY